MARSVDRFSEIRYGPDSRFHGIMGLLPAGDACLLFLFEMPARRELGFHGSPGPANCIAEKLSQDE